MTHIGATHTHAGTRTEASPFTSTLRSKIFFLVWPRMSLLGVGPMGVPGWEGGGSMYVREATPDLDVSFRFVLLGIYRPMILEICQRCAQGSGSCCARTSQFRQPAVAVAAASASIRGLRVVANEGCPAGRLHCREVAPIQPAPPPLRPEWIIPPTTAPRPPFSSFFPIFCRSSNPPVVPF